MVRVAAGRHQEVATIARYGDFAVHEYLGDALAEDSSDDLLSVTHVPTGACLPDRFTADEEGRRRAKRAAQAFAIVFDGEDMSVEEPNHGGGRLHPNDSIKRRAQALMTALGERP